MAARAAASRRPARATRFLISISCARPSGGDVSLNCEPDESTHVFHFPACGSICGAVGRQRFGKNGLGMHDGPRRTGAWPAPSCGQAGAAPTRTVWFARPHTAKLVSIKARSREPFLRMMVVVKYFIRSLL